MSTSNENQHQFNEEFLINIDQNSNHNENQQIVNENNQPLFNR